jgi:glycyl-tRNA synthetase beta chain
MAELLLELFSEEIPARMQRAAAEQLKTITETKFKEEELFFSKLHTFVTPRRLVLVAEGMSLTQEDKIVERRGPRADAPAQAVEGFLKSAGLVFEQLQKRQTDKGEFYFAVTQQKGKSTREVLTQLLPKILESLPWPKSMRWGEHTIRWVRPLKNICCVFGGDPLKLRFGHLVSNDQSFGHRFLAPDSFKVREFKQYAEELKNRYVILSSDDRMALIMEKAESMAEGKELLLHKDESLLEEVAGLVEWPEVLLGSIEHKFMHVPQEVLITSVRTHQKYFSLLKADGRLAPHFLVVTNTVTQSGGREIIEGNERVLKARLSDASFFWDQDRKVPLPKRLPKLEHIIFHAKLGTMAEKVERMGHLAQYLCMWVPHANLTLTERACQLAKADLVTEMVGEFPELQGIMGCYYAKEQGEDESVALAIREHYSPLGPGDDVPTKPLSIAVALADKLDTLAGMFAAGEKPTGSKDPFALRRSALGIIRIILENGLSVPLKLALSNALARYPRSMFHESGDGEEAGAGKKILKKLAPTAGRAKPAEVVNELLEFIIDRLKVSLKGSGVRHDMIAAVFGRGDEDDLLRLTRRAASLAKFLGTPDGENLLAAYRRAVNIVGIEEKKDNSNYRGAPVKLLLEEDAERELFEALHAIKGDIKKLLKENQFESAMALLAKLRKPIDTFFERVKVNSEKPDVRRNRLLLLSQMRELVDEIADFSRIE